MDRTNYCAECERHAREAGRLRAEIEAKDAEWKRFTLAVGLADGDQGRYLHATVDEAIDEIKREQAEHMAEIDRAEAAEARAKELEEDIRRIRWRIDEALGIAIAPDGFATPFPAVAALLRGAKDLLPLPPSGYTGSQRIAELEAQLAEARNLLSDGGVYFYWRRIKAQAKSDPDARRIYQQVPVNLSALLDGFVDAIDDAREDD